MYEPQVECLSPHEALEILQPNLTINSGSTAMSPKQAHEAKNYVLNSINPKLLNSNSFYDSDILAASQNVGQIKKARDYLIKNRRNVVKKRTNRDLDFSPQIAMGIATYRPPPETERRRFGPFQSSTDVALSQALQQASIKAAIRQDP